MFEMVVYYDASFPGTWINANKGYPAKIAKAFSAKNVRILDAPSLEQFIHRAIENYEANQRLAVFSQDVIPATIVESHSAANTFREYLDAGGSVLWIGDIPLWSVGNAREKTEIANEGGPAEILGVNPSISVPKTSVTITNLGRLIGLRTKWSGMRPIIKDTGIKPLAISENLISRYYIDIEKRKSWFKRHLGTIESIKAMDFEVSFGKESDQSKSVKGAQYSLHLHETHVNAWMKCFNSYFPNCGFYRIWDYPPVNLTDKMVEELFTIAERISHRISRTSQTFWLHK
jgi:hypothetical protein